MHPQKRYSVAEAAELLGWSEQQTLASQSLCWRRDHNGEWYCEGRHLSDVIGRPKTIAKKLLAGVPSLPHEMTGAELPPHISDEEAHAKIYEVAAMIREREKEVTGRERKKVGYKHEDAETPEYRTYIAHGRLRFGDPM